MQPDQCDQVENAIPFVMVECNVLTLIFSYKFLPFFKQRILSKGTFHGKMKINMKIQLSF